MIPSQRQTRSQNGKNASQSCPELDWPSWLGNSHPTVLDQTGALFSRMWWYSWENVGLNHFKVLPTQRFCHPQGRISSYLSIAQRWPGQPDTVQYHASFASSIPSNPCSLQQSSSVHHFSSFLVSQGKLAPAPLEPTG